jgi:hypothetical protein
VMMSPTDTLCSSCGVNLKPPAPACIIWTFGSLDPVDEGDADDASEAVGVDDTAEEAALVIEETSCAKTDGKRWLAAMVIANFAVQERAIASVYTKNRPKQARSYPGVYLGPI